MEGEDIERKLIEIEDYMKGSYYPFILEYVDEFYDQIRKIRDEANKLSEEHAQLTQMNSELLSYQQHIGTKISEDEFTSYINTLSDKITEFEQKEGNLITLVNSLYEEVRKCIDEYDSEVQKSKIPLTTAEADAMLAKQDQVIQDINVEIQHYRQREKELSERIAKFQANTQGMSTDDVAITEEEKNSVSKTIYWLYSLIRIIKHSVGIEKITKQNNIASITYKNGAKLEIELTNETIVANAHYSLPNSPSPFRKFVTDYNSVVQRSIGKEWTYLVTMFLYYILSQDRFEKELAEIQGNIVSYENRNELVVRFENGVQVCLRIPNEYPRTMERITVTDISTISLNVGCVNKLTSNIRNKQFFTVVDAVNFIKENME